MNKVFTGLLVVIGLIIMFTLMPGFVDSTDDLRTSEQIDSYAVTTAVNATTTNVVLSQDLWQNGTGYVSGITSDAAADNPIANTYTPASNTLNVIGLEDDVTRNLTVTYSMAALDDYQGMSQMSGVTPTIMYLLLIAVAIAIMYKMFASNRG